MTTVPFDSDNVGVFLEGQYEGIWLVLEALFGLEVKDWDGTEISREWVTQKLNDLMLNDFTDRILDTYLPIKEEK
jgi:hypothetical protein